MAYSNELNTKLNSFFGRAQDRIAENALANSKLVRDRKFNKVHKDNALESEKLDWVLSLLDNHYNTLSEKEIHRIVDRTEAKHNLSKKVYIEKTSYNLNITFEGADDIVSIDGGVI